MRATHRSLLDTMTYETPSLLDVKRNLYTAGVSFLSSPET